MTAGSRIGHYDIVAAIGAGGMGEVYRATDTRLGRDVALKVLPPAMASSPDRLARFQREARAVAALNHRHIVTIHSVEEADGVHFLTMELVEGLSLDRAIPGTGLTLDRFLDIASALAEALIAAHEKGLVHRDLKPANIMIAADGQVKVLDFGLVKELHAADPADATVTSGDHTAAGVVMGTPAYMSPEQLAGRAVDHRTDIFSLGILLYEMATGRRPFAGASSAELASAILRDSPRPVGEIRADLPDDLSRIIGRCLEKDPRGRLQTARDVGAELRELQNRWPTTPNRVATRVSTGAAVALAVLPFSDLSPARDQDYLCEGMAEEIMNALVRVSGIRVASRTSAFRARQELGGLPAIARALSVGHVLEGSVRTSGSRLRVTTQLTDVASGYQVWSERFDREAADIFAVQDEIAAGVVEAVKARLVSGGPTVRSRPQVGNLEAYREYLKGRHLRYMKADYVGALRCYARAVELDPSGASSWVGLADVNMVASFYSLIPAADASAAAKNALATAARLHGESAEALFVESMIAVGERAWRTAERVVLRAIELQPGYVQARCWNAWRLNAFGRLDEALQHLQHAREVDPLAPYPYAMTGVTLLGGGRAAEAMRYFDQALTFERENILAQWGAGLALVALGRSADGVAQLERATTPAHQGGFIHGALGWALAACGRTDDARRVLDVLRSRPDSAPVVVSQAWLLAALEQPSAALDVLERAEREEQLSLVLIGLPGYDPLRADPRFRALVERLGLPARA